MEKRHIRINERGVKTLASLNLKKAAFLTWFKNSQKGNERTRGVDPERNWPSFFDGKATPRIFAEVLCEYLHQARLGEFLPTDISDECEPEGTGRPPDPLGGTAGFRELNAHLERALAGEEGEYCESDDDVREAGRMVMETVGEREDSHVNGERAIAIASKLMGQSLDEYCEHLQTIVTANQQCVRFARMKIAGKTKRVGVVSIIPLIDWAAAVFRDGKLEPTDITAEHITSPSPFILISALAENRDLGVKGNRKERNWALMKTLMHQAAQTTPFGSKWLPSLHVFTFAGTDQGGKSAKPYGFRETGTLTPKTGKPIIEIAPPRHLYFPSPVHIGMWGSIMMFQIAISPQRFFSGD